MRRFLGAGLTLAVLGACSLSPTQAPVAVSLVSKIAQDAQVTVGTFTPGLSSIKPGTDLDHVTLKGMGTISVKLSPGRYSIVGTANGQTAYSYFDVTANAPTTLSLTSTTPYTPPVAPSSAPSASPSKPAASASPTSASPTPSVVTPPPTSSSSSTGTLAWND